MFEETPLHIANDDESFRVVVERLQAAKVIGVDTESDSFHHYQEKVCLIQFSDLSADYIVDPLGISDMSALGPIFADPTIVKIFHGADYDVVCMKRDFHFEVRSIFDTMISAQMLGFERVGLADLIERFFGWEIDKHYQRHDWAARPLLDEHLDYARGATHFLLALREILNLRLQSAGRLEHLAEECTLLEAREWEGRGFDPDGYLRMKTAGTLDDVGKRILRRLYLYRDSEARKMDRPAFKVLPDPILVEIADRRPRSTDALDRLFDGKTAMKRRFGTGMLDAVEQGLGDDFDIPKPKRPTRVGTPPRLTGRAAERAFNALKEWRNQILHDEPRKSPLTVASNAVLKAVASQRPTTLEELGAISDVRRWQAKEYGEAMLSVLEEAVPANSLQSLEAGDDSDLDDRPRRRRRRRRH